MIIINSHGGYCCILLYLEFDAESTYAVLSISGCRLYSLENTKGTMPCGRAACTMETRNTVPLRPTATEAIAITAGPAKNLTSMPYAASLFPHAMILGWRAMNRPASPGI